MNRARLSHDPLEKQPDSDVPQIYRDIIGGMVNRCKQYDEDADYWMFDRDVATELYGVKMEKMVNWHDTIVMDEHG